MAKNERRRLKPALLQGDKDCFAALLKLEGYEPLNSRYAMDALRKTHDDLNSAQQVEALALAAAATARQSALAKEWEFHNVMLGAKDQVVAQFGRDSNEAAAVGLKKKSEYKSRTRKAAGETNT